MSNKTEPKKDTIEIFVQCEGDSSVGIWPTSYAAKLEIDADFFFDAENKADFVSELCKFLESYTDGGKAITAQELERINRMEAEIERQEMERD